MFGTAWFIGFRYLRRRGTSGYVSFVSMASMAGIMLGVMALIVVVSVMNGFDSQLKHRILGAVPHVIVTADGIPHDALAKRLASLDGIVRSVPYRQREALLVGPRGTRLVLVQGVDPATEAAVSVLPGAMVRGTLADLVPGGRGIVIGERLRWSLGFERGSPVTLVFPEVRNGDSVAPRLASARLTGSFQLDSELDYGLVVMHVADVPAAADSTRLVLEDLLQAPLVAAQVEALIDGAHAIAWTARYGDFFRTVRMEKIMMFVLLSLVVAIAGFNIVSSLSVMVDEKRSDIAVLGGMGASRADVRLIFIVHGSLVGLAGTLLGNLVGLPFAANVSVVVAAIEELTGGSMLAGTYFNRVPSELRWTDIAMINLVAVAISVTAALYPASRAASLDPAAVLKAEG